jgi:hypothetical protein
MIGGGIERNKLVFGLQAATNTFKLVDSDNYQPHSVVNKSLAGLDGKLKDPSSTTYFEVPGTNVMITVFGDFQQFSEKWRFS